MRPLRDLLPVTVFILGVISAAGYAQTPTPQDERLSITKDVMDEVAHQQIAPVCERFSSDLKDSMPQDQLDALLKQLTDVSGAFQKQLSQTTVKVGSTPIYISKSQYENYKVELHLEFNDTNQITRFWIAPVSDLTPETMEATAKEIANLLSKKDFDQLTDKYFDDRLSATMPAERLEASWAHVLAHLGQFKSLKLVQKDPEFDLVDVRCEFDNGEIIVRVAFDPSGKVGGFWMLPADSESPGGSQV